MLDGHAVAISDADPDGVILAVRMGLFHSGDQGRSWQDMQVGRFSAYTYARDIRVSPQDPMTLYACLSVAANSQAGALFRSTGYGQTWQRFDKVEPHSTVWRWRCTIVIRTRCIWLRVAARCSVRWTAESTGRT